MPCSSSEHWTWCSDCVTLDIGCYLKWWNGQEWIDADKGRGDCLAGINGKFSDGNYCYTVVNGVVTVKSPCSATLMVRYEFDTFYAELTEAIDATITISAGLSVKGFTDTCVTESLETDTATGNLVIIAGNLTGSVAGSSGMTTYSQYYNFDGNQLTINGTARGDSSSFVVGSTKIFLSYPQASCATYSDI